jgi:hypothetical protein
MNQDQIFGILRIVLPPLLAYMAGRGWMTSAQAAGLLANLPEIMTVIVTIGGGIWSFVVHSNQGKVASVAAMPAHDINTATAALPAQDKLAIAAALPEVKNITTTKELAAAVPNVKVTNGFVAPKK